MNYIALNNLLSKIEHYVGFPTMLMNYCNDMYSGYETLAGYTSSRNLEDALATTVKRYISNGPNAHKFLFGLCTLINPSKRKIRIMPYYRAITTEESTTLQLNKLLAPSARPQTNADTIHICYISKGKSFAKTLLESPDNIATNLKNIEAILTQDSNHFIKVYKGFTDTNPNDITIFTSEANARLISGITTLLPLLFDIIPKEIPEACPPEFLKEVEEYNTKLTHLTEIFAILFQTLNNNTDNSDTAHNTIRDLCNKFATLFNFESSLLTDFSKNLAKAHITNATRYLQNEIDNTQRRIREQEQVLSEHYNKLQHYQRELVLHSAATEDDVTPFINTIRSSKAIEVLDGNGNNIRLRITAPLQFFTPSDFEAYEKNTNSEYNRNYTDPTIKKIMHKIFVTREYSLMLQSIIRIRLNQYYERDILTFDAQTDNLSEFKEIPNPHLYKHNCWREARTEMQKNIAKGDYELVVMQMIAATQSVNVAEGASFINGLLMFLKTPEMLQKAHVIDNTTKQTYSWKDLIKHESGIAIEEAKEEQQGYQQVVLQDEGLTPEEEAILAQIQNRQNETNTRMMNAAAQTIPTEEMLEEAAINVAQAREEVVNDLLRNAVSAQPLPETYWATEEEQNETH